jgi:DNA-binding CsgD family transcriptional regulator
MIGPPLPHQLALSKFIYNRWPLVLSGRLSPIQEKILRLVHARVRQADIARALDMHPSSVYVHITCIRAKGFLI